VHVLLVEPYHGGSHAAWADGYAARSRHRVTLVSHEARFWKWRMHGSHLTLAAAARAALGNEPPDVVLVSSMTNVAAFLGAMRDLVANAPVVVYFHESQFSYPPSPRDRPDATYPMLNWSSAAVADAVVFNSEFHRDDFFTRAERFLRRFPDHRHGELLEAARFRSVVLPVGIDLPAITTAPATMAGDPPLLLWNQRWEHDKDPDTFVDAVTDLRAAGVPFRLAVAGTPVISVPPCLRRLPPLLGEDLIWFGHAPLPVYRSLLRSADVVVSTARHEFFGIAVVEAIAAGAFPVLPNRLVYPEHIPDELHDICLYEDADDLHRLLTVALDDPSVRRRGGVLAGEMRGYDWRVVAPAMDRLVTDLAGAAVRTPHAMIRDPLPR